MILTILTKNIPLAPPPHPHEKKCDRVIIPMNKNIPNFFPVFFYNMHSNGIAYLEHLTVECCKTFYHQTLYTSGLSQFSPHKFQKVSWKTDKFEIPSIKKL